jgi:hypothetical protein
MIPDEFIQVSILLFGKDFSPAAFRDHTGLAIRECLEPGSLGRSGRTIECGSASIDLPACSQFDSSDTLHAIKGIQDSLANYTGPGKVSEVIVHITARYEDQCNLEFPLPFLKSVSDLGANLTLTCSRIDPR